MLKHPLIKAAERAGSVLKQYYGSEFKISNKEGINNLVTEADHAAEKAIMDIIKHDFPEHDILSEEAGEVYITGRKNGTNGEYKWIIDPIDGTVNFANAIPICCVSIALEYRGKMLMGAVYNPILNEFFFAEKGQGATLNGKKISVSNKTEVLTGCLVTGFPYTYIDQP